jgi:hypothetical protein
MAFAKCIASMTITSPQKNHARLTPKRQKAYFEKQTQHRQYGVKGTRPLAGCGAAPHKNNPK